MTEAPFVELTWRPGDVGYVPQVGRYIGDYKEVLASHLMSARMAVVADVRGQLTKATVGVITAHQLLEMLDLAWSIYLPSFMKVVGPLTVEAYYRAYRASAAGEVPTEYINALAEQHVGRTASYFHETSAEAVEQGFTTYVNRRVPARAAAERVVQAYGLSPRQMSGYIAATASMESKINSSAASIPDKAKGYITKSLLSRFKLFAAQEDHNVTQEAQQVIWLWMQEHGQLTPFAQKVWITAKDEKVCPQCGPLHGMKIGIKEKFKSKEGEFWVPGLHVNCRCVVRLQDHPLRLVSKAFDPKEHPRGKGGLFTTVAHQITDDDRNHYVSERCNDLAMSIHQKTGWPVWGVYTTNPDDEREEAWWHTGVITPDGQWLDVEGKRPLEEAQDRWAEFLYEEGNVDLEPIKDFGKNDGTKVTARSKRVADALLKENKINKADDFDPKEHPRSRATGEFVRKPFERTQSTSGAAAAAAPPPPPEVKREEAVEEVKEYDYSSAVDFLAEAIQKEREDRELERERHSKPILDRPQKVQRVQRAKPKKLQSAKVQRAKPVVAKPTRKATAAAKPKTKATSEKVKSRARRDRVRRVPLPATDPRRVETRDNIAEQIRADRNILAAPRPRLPDPATGTRPTDPFIIPVYAMGDDLHSPLDPAGQVQLTFKTEFNDNEWAMANKVEAEFEKRINKKLDEIDSYNENRVFIAGIGAYAYLSPADWDEVVRTVAHWDDDDPDSRAITDYEVEWETEDGEHITRSESPHGLPKTINTADIAENMDLHPEEFEVRIYRMDEGHQSSLGETTMSTSGTKHGEEVWVTRGLYTAKKGDRWFVGGNRPSKARVYYLTPVTNEEELTRRDRPVPPEDLPHDRHTGQTGDVAGYEEELPPRQLFPDPRTAERIREKWTTGTTRKTGQTYDDWLSDKDRGD